MLKGFWGRYYNNLADGFSSANPGGTNYAEYNFLDQNRNNRYDGPSGARHASGSASAARRRRSTPTSRRRTPTRSAASLEHQFWGESSRAVHLCAQEPVTTSCRSTSPRSFPAWLGQVNGADTRRVDGGETFTLLDVPASIADQTNAPFDNWPDGDFHYDTIEVAFNKRFSDRFFAQSSFDYIWRDELRSADISNWGIDQPAQHRSDRRRAAAYRQPGGAEPAAVDDVPPADVGAVHVPGRMSASR